MLEMHFLISSIVLFSFYSSVNTKSVQIQSLDKTFTFNDVEHKQEIDSVLYLVNKTSSESSRLYANFSSYVDMMCVLIQHNDYLDTIELPERMSEFFLFRNYFDNGELEGLRTIKRKGECFVNYEVKLLLLVTKYHFEHLQVTYDLLVKFLFIDMNFKFTLTMEDADIETGVLVDAYRFQFTMDRVVIPQVRTLRIEFKGESFLGWIIDKISAIATCIFKRQFIHRIETAIVDMIQYEFDHLPFFNKTLPIHVSPYCADGLNMTKYF